MLQFLYHKALVVNLREAGKRLGLLTIQNLLFVHVHYVELVFASWKSPIGIRLSLDFEEEPVAVSTRVRIRFQIQIEFSRLHLDCQVKVPTLKDRVKSQVTCGRILIRLESALVDWAAWSESVKTVLNSL